MILSHFILSMAMTGQVIPAPVTPAPVPAGVATFDGTAPEFADIALPAAPAPAEGFTGFVPAGEVPMDSPLGTARAAFQSDHEFDGFTGPLSNPVQFKDPRSLTEARLIFMQNWTRPSTPVIGQSSMQVYALQLRLALTERLQIFADKDGIVRLSPKGTTSTTGLANIAAGAKYVFLRNVETQTLGSLAVQYEAPTGYANIFQNQGSGLLGIWGIFGQEFGDGWHGILQIGQNLRMNKIDSGYFMTSAHIDKRFGKFTPFYEANWFYYNQTGTFLPTLNTEGGGLLNVGAGKVMGLNYVTNAIGFKYDLTPNAELGVGYEFQLSDRAMLLGNMVHAQLILRY
ncbi:hypothetical protein GC170_10415 [bacterium]|nr:hypothetical protein [bacterium]